MSSRIAIVGASLAGMHAAHTLRRDGYEGALTIVDAQAHEPYDRPPLSKQILAGTWDADRITLPAAKEELDAIWRLGEPARRLDLESRSVELATGDIVDFDGLIVATGAGARRLPGQPDLPGIHVIRTIDDALGLRGELDSGARRVVVIGAGFIGAEVAATCRGRGLDVTIVEVADVPLERALGRQMGEVCADLHREHGVDLRLGVSITGFEGTDRVTGVELADGTVVPADVVVVGVGVELNTGWLEGSGLTVDDGVVCDETLLAAPGVVAAGDIARWPSRRYGQMLRVEHWENAVQMGEAAACRLLVDLGLSDAAPEAYDPIPWFWSDQYDRKIQLLGRSGANHDVEVVIGSTDEKRFVALYGLDGIVTGVLGMNRPRHVMQLRSVVEDRLSWDEALRRAKEFA